MMDVRYSARKPQKPWKTPFSIGDNTVFVKRIDQAVPCFCQPGIDLFQFLPDRLQIIQPVKEECERKITRLESRLFTASSGDTDIEGLLRKAIENLSRLEQLWEEAIAERKRLIIGSIFPEKLVFDGNTFQTARLNEGVRLIYTLNEGFSGNEKGQKTDISALSSSVTRIGFKPMTPNLEGLCSIQLSYRVGSGKIKKNRPSRQTILSPHPQNSFPILPPFP